MNIPFHPRAKIYTDSATLKNSDLFSEDQIIVATVSGKTYTLPTPVADNKGKVAFFLNTAASGQTLSCTGNFVGNGNTVAIGATTMVELRVMPVSSSSYKWGVVGVASATAISQEAIEDVIGAMVLGNTETGIAVTYDDAAAKLNFEVSPAVPVKATGAEVDTGTDDAKFVTAKAMEDSSYAKTTAIPVKATGAEVDTGTDDAKFVTAKALADSNYATLSDVDTPSPTGIGTTITDCTAKATPVDADLLLISDSAAANVGKKSTVAQMRSVLMSADALGTVIAGLAAKASPIDADSIVIVDSADTNDAKETTIAELRAVMLAADGLGTAIAGLAAKATPIDADSFALRDSADTNDAKETTIGELKAVILSANNVGGAIAGYAAKASPIDADSIVICDSADTNDAKETTIAELRTALLAADPLGTALAALDAKATPIDADSIVVVDSADTDNAKETTVAQLRSVLLAADPLGTAIAALDAKAAPIDADSFLLVDSADTNNAKEVTLAQIKAVLGWNAIAAFTPTIAWSGGAPTVSAEVYRQKTEYDWCKWRMDIAGTNGNNATTLTVDFPAAMVPTDVNMKVPVKCQVSVNNGAFVNVLATLDCEAAASADRQLVVATGTLTDTQAFRIIIAGEHEITPA